MSHPHRQVTNRESVQELSPRSDNNISSTLERNPDCGLPGGKLGSLSRGKGLHRTIKNWIGTFTALSLLTFGTMSAYQHEAPRTRASYSSLPEGTPRSSGYDRRNHGLVGVGASDQTMAAAGAKFFGDLGGPRLSREAKDRRRTGLLSCQPGATGAARKFDGMNLVHRR